MLSKRKQFNRMGIGAGDLKHRITIQTADTTAPAGSGVDATMTFTNVCTVYSAIETVTPKQPFDGVNIVEPVTHRFYIRHLSGVNISHFILHGDTRYKIIQLVNISGLQEWLRLDCNIKASTSKVASSW